jgi:tripartite-type tricarboxylate transporter receptor subunit TctC
MPAGYAGNPSLYKKLPYDQNRELTPVSCLASDRSRWWISVAAGKIGQEFIAFARARRGEEINFGSSGAGTCPIFPPVVSNSMSGIKMVHPLRAPGAAVTDVMAGRVPVYFT